MAKKATRIKTDTFAVRYQRAMKWRWRLKRSAI